MCLLILIGRRLDQRKRKMLYSVAVLKIYVKRTPEGVLFGLIGDRKSHAFTIIFYTIIGIRFIVQKSNLLISS